ncbi:MAG: aminotransferase class III-fold pyridoxal phosphate-dependent enzyme [Candidatus Riflebacteria bacterium]|nr:aminotransferase class III-fold pyridoxal phosphate-dependent enzyme [Candidatus Riflebacteria bacterium]
MTSDIDFYTKFCKPGLGKLLSAFSLDVRYERAFGDFLSYHDEKGQEVEVLDLVGSFGATLFGHNYPPLVEEMKSLLAQNQPNFVQASIRGGAAFLGKRLNEEAIKRLEADYCSAFFNTGSDAVEAAIKHLVLIQNSRRNSLRENILIRSSQIIRKQGSVQKKIRLGKISDFPKEIFESDSDLLSTIDQYNISRQRRSYKILALENAYHGQTLGALGMTFNERFRKPFDDCLMEVKFVRPLFEAVEEAISQLEDFLVEVVEHENSLCLVPVPIFDVLGLFVEPIQGEGGAIRVDENELQKITKFACEKNIPLVADEIQTGIGRTGKFFAWERVGKKELAPSFLLLSKFLGGGLCKISAVMSRREITQDEFGIIHASTFAEDEIGCLMAQKTIELLLENDEQMLRKVVQAETEWKKRLQALVEEFPDVICSIRGLGLLLGVEFQDFSECESHILRLISLQGDLGFLIAGFLLREHNIRVAPSFNTKRTVRIEPSLNVSFVEMDKTIQAFRTLCQALRNRDIGSLCRFLMPGENCQTPIEIHDCRRDPEDFRQAPPIASERVAFLGHFINPRFFGLNEPGFSRFPPEQLKGLIEKTWEFLDPCLFVSRDIVSKTGTKVNFNFVGIPVTSEIFLERFRQRKLGIVRDVIRKAVNVAKDFGCRLVGFGQFTSIVTRNCLEIAVPPIGFTTGNSLTTAMAISALKDSLANKSLDIKDVRVAMLGAGGNIGATFSRLLADAAKGVVLVGGTSQDSLTRLYKTLGEILLDQFVILEGPPGPFGNVAKWFDSLVPHEERRKILENHFSEKLLREGVPFNSEFLEKVSVDDRKKICNILLEKVKPFLKSDSPIQIGTLNDCLNCRGIVTATNTTNPVLFPKHIKPDTVICDVSVPSAVASETCKVSGVEIFKGGVVQLPNKELLNIGALPLEPGLVYACMAETIILGLERRWNDYSIGDISKPKVMEIQALAAKHGFTLARAKFEDSQ